MNAYSLFLVPLTFVAAMAAAAEPSLPMVRVEAQPLFAQVRRVIEALEYLGEPLPSADRQALEALMQSSDVEAVGKVQGILDAHCLFAVHINPEMRVKVASGPAKAELVEAGWRQFLVKVANEAGTTAALACVSPNGASLFDSNTANTPSDRAFHQRGKPGARPATDLWLDLQMFDKQPLRPTLSALPVEYRLVQLYSRDAGRREAKVAFNVGQGTQDLGFRNEMDVLFNCVPAHQITLRVRDENGKPATGALLIRDAAGRVYPSQAKRLAPDFAFHPQVYRAEGEKLRLPEGVYDIEFQRGPESVPERRRVEVKRGTTELAFKVARWIDPARWGWWSGDHHIHAAGCAHYTNPTEGVHAPDMARHCQGEDLKIGANLTWGPCFNYQKQFFTGKDDKVSRYPYLLRYDIEVSGFGSHRSGHLCLLRLQEQMYPGGDSKDHWPTLCLNTLRWAKKQGALAGPAHSGWGLQPQDSQPSRVTDRASAPDVALPNYLLPRFDGIGANEYIVDVTHEVPGPDGSLVPAVDFLSTVDTPAPWELNIWYHTLNAGFRTRISGETDFPCIYGERVGLGRSYVKLDGKLNYEDWCEGIRAGRNYVSDGRSHILEFAAAAPAPGSGRSAIGIVRMGERGSELRLTGAQSVKFTARVAARLNAEPDPAMKGRPLSQKPYWDIERARIGGSQEVPVELIFNGQPVARRKLVADGTLREVTFEVPVERSGWAAVRIYPSSHTNPIWLMVDGRPVRASRRSIEWCLQGVDQCWSQKEKLIAPAELDDARAAYEHARQTYRRRLAECEVE
jgi:hypothetical protein